MGRRRQDGAQHQAGQGREPAHAAGLALASAAALPRAKVEVVVSTVEPTVGSEAVTAAKELATTAMSAPVTVTAGTVTAQIPGKAVGRALSFTAQDGAPR